MRKLLWISLAVIVAFVGGRLLYYGFGGAYTAPDRPLPVAQFDAAARSARFEAVDNPAVSKGVVVLDYGHDNAFFVEELNVLLSKVVARGFSYEIVTASEDAAAAQSSKTKEPKVETLTDKLRYAEALILPLPRKEYTTEEITEIKRFVEKGGRVLLIGDPTRTVIVEALNSIAGSFGIIYANDYLYNLASNDNNYRNVVYTNFKVDSPLTRGLNEERKVIFYSGGSVNAPGHEIILGDESTHSSTSEGGRAMAAAALTTNDRVLALGDMTFFAEPYSAAEGNGTLINNIADFLIGGQRDFELKDFPHFFNPHVEVVFHDTLVFNSQFGDSVKLKQQLEDLDYTVTFADRIGETGDNDVIFVGRFDDAEVVQSYLDDAGITIIESPEETDFDTPVVTKGEEKTSPVSDTSPGKEDRFVKGRIQIEGVGDLERGGSTLFYLNREHNRNIVIILSDNPETNADAFNVLLENRLDECRVSATVAVCQTQEPDGGLPPSLRSKRIDKVLVVASDTGRAREDELTGQVDFSQVLETKYEVDTWLLSEEGSPDIDQLLEYDAVIWTTGDYWDDSIGEEDAALLLKYIEIGGNLILSGASIAFDWDHTDFLTQVAHADYTGFGEQKDLEVAMPEHPIAEGFAEGDVISMTTTPSSQPLEIDVVTNTPNARVIFQRGPDSEEAGAASVIAFEDDRSRVAYYAFPIYLLPAEQQDQLISNTISWFTKKSLGLPSGKPATTKEEQPDKESEPEEPADDTNGENQDQENGENGDDQNGQDDQNQDDQDNDTGNG